MCRQRKNLEKRERLSGCIDKIKFVDVRFYFNGHMFIAAISS